MAHPYSGHKQHKVERSRVSHIAKGYATGGAVHPDEAQDKKLIGKMIREHDREVEGGKAKHRADRPHRAMGGKVKSNRSKATKVNVIVNAGGGQPAAPPMLPPPGPPPMPPAAMMPPKPPMAPPPAAGLGPMPAGGAGPVPGMPPRADGGRAYAKGGAVKSGPAYEEGLRNGTQVSHRPGKNDLKDLHRGKPITYATGGRIESSKGVASATKLPGGAGGGEGRLAKIRKYGPK